MNCKGLTLKERVVYWRDKAKLFERNVIRLEKEICFLKDKLEFLQIRRPDSISWSRGRWLFLLKENRNKKRGG